jgi:hypothetical protein
LVLFVRIGTFQWVTAIPNKKSLLASLLPVSAPRGATSLPTIV